MFWVFFVIVTTPWGSDRFLTENNVLDLYFTEKFLLKCSEFLVTAEMFWNFSNLHWK